MITRPAFGDKEMRQPLATYTKAHKQQPAIAPQSQQSQLSQQSQQYRQLQQQEQQRQLELGRRERGRAVVTRVLPDILVFAEVHDRGLGLVFRPDKIEGYRGEALDSIGVVIGANLDSIEWHPTSLRVTSVVVAGETSGPEQVSVDE